MFDMRDRITKQRFVLATGNKGKVKEIADVLADFGFEVIAQTDLGIESPIESLFNFKTSYGYPPCFTGLFYFFRKCRKFISFEKSVGNLSKF